MKVDRVIKLPVFRAMFMPVARKAWRCDLCHEQVQLNGRYVHYVDRGLHEIKHYRFHIDCFKIVEAYCKEKGKTMFTPRAVLYWAKKAYCASCEEECRVHACDKIKSATTAILKRKRRREI